MSRKFYKPRKPPGHVYRPRLKEGCPWCLHGDRPSLKAGLCQRCVEQFRRYLQSKKWARFRRAFLSNPATMYCVDCKDHTPAFDLDHTYPWRFFPDLFWDMEHIVGRCHSHHSQKTYREDGGISGLPQKLFGDDIPEPDNSF